MVNMYQKIDRNKNETELNDDYPIFPGYIYIVTYQGEDRIIEIEGNLRTVGDIKRCDVNISKVYRCDLVSRGLI